jgi:hypothetical protein
LLARSFTHPVHWEVVATSVSVGRERFRRGRGFLGNLLLAAASCGLVALAIVATELLVRRLAPAYLVETRGIHVFSPEYGWIGRPGAVASMGSGRVTLNRNGYRGPELPPRRDGGPTRVVVIGDSIAFGYGVADEQTFTHLLDTRDKGIAAANMGVQGFGPGQELLVLQREGLRADPDVVVLAVCFRNDLADAVLPVALYNGVNPRPRYRLVADQLVLDDAGVRLSAFARVVSWLSDHSHLYNRLSALLARPEPSEESWRIRKADALRDSDYALRLSVALVLEMQRLCRARGVQLLVATFPGEHAYETEPELQRRFHDALRNAGVRTVALREELRARGLGASDVTLDETGHLSPAGHRATAGVLESEILRVAGPRL